MLMQHSDTATGIGPDARLAMYSSMFVRAGTAAGVLPAARRGGVEVFVKCVFMQGNVC